MTKWNMRSHRKVTGGLLRKNTKKKKYMRGRDFIPVHVAETRRVKARTRGGGRKIRLHAANVANVVVGGKMQTSKILAVKENAADSQFVRRNIITKGAIIETELGYARVTSRPGQHGVANAVIVEPKAETKGKGK